MLKPFLGKIFNLTILKNYSTNFCETYRVYIAAYKDSKY